jgi:hypothetical protein
VIDGRGHNEERTDSTQWEMCPRSLLLTIKPGGGVEQLTQADDSLKVCKKYVDHGLAGQAKGNFCFLKTSEEVQESEIIAPLTSASQQIKGLVIEIDRKKPMQKQLKS